MNSNEIYPSNDAEYSNMRSIRNPRNLVGSILFTIIYLYIVYWFLSTDLFNNYFDTPTPLYLVYHLFKALFAFYLLWYLYFLGYICIRFVQGKNFSFGLQGLEQFVVAFYVGAGVVCIVILALGYLNLYYPQVMLLLTTPVFFLSFTHLNSTLSSLPKQWKIAKRKPRVLLHTAIILLIILLGIGLFVNKTLFPYADRDSVLHYVPYYSEVVANHGVLPNNVWYHYYYSKGSGVMFLSILTSDIAGQKTASFVAVLVASLVIYLLVKRVISNSTWALTAILVYFSVLIFEPIFYLNAVYSRSIFEKQHIFMSSLFVGIIYMMTLISEIPKKSLAHWLLLLCIVVTHLIIFVPTSFAFIFPTLVLYSVYYFIRKRKEFQLFASVGTVALITILAILIINYLTTGLAESTPQRLWWSLANQEKFSQWMSPYLWEYLNAGSNPSLGTFTLTKDYSLGEWYYNLFQLDQIFYLLPNIWVVGLIVIVVGISLAQGEQLLAKTTLTIIPIVVLLVTSGLTSLVLNQPLSMFRYFIFTTPFLIVLAISLWYYFLAFGLKQGFQSSVMIIAPILIICAALIHMVERRGFPAPAKTQFEFLFGDKSFADAYSAIGAYWPELVEAKKSIGIQTRLLTLNLVPAVGAVPGRPVETEINYGYLDWHQMVFGLPDIARKAFKKEGINYFIFNLDYKFSEGALPLSPLFTADSLNDHFDVVWTKGNTYLLTWKGEAQQATSIPISVIDKFKMRLTDDDIFPDLYDRIKLYFDKNNGAAYPVFSDPSLPPVKGWQ